VALNLKTVEICPPSILSTVRGGNRQGEGKRKRREVGGTSYSREEKASGWGKKIKKTNWHLENKRHNWGGGTLNTNG